MVRPVGVFKEKRTVSSLCYVSGFSIAAIVYCVVLRANHPEQDHHTRYPAGKDGAKNGIGCDRALNGLRQR